MNDDTGLYLRACPLSRGDNDDDDDNGLPLLGTDVLTSSRVRAERLLLDMEEPNTSSLVPNSRASTTPGPPSYTVHQVIVLIPVLHVRSTALRPVDRPPTHRSDDYEL